MKFLFYLIVSFAIPIVTIAQNGGMCRIHLIKESSNNQKTKTYRVSRKSKFSHSTSKSNNSEVQMLYLSSGRSGSITVDDTVLKITCYKRHQMFEIELDLVGTKEGISTSLTLGRGARTNVGEIVKDLKSEAKKMDINYGIEQKKMSGQKKVNYYLEVK